MKRVITAIYTATASALLLTGPAMARTQATEPESAAPTRTVTATPATPAPSAPASKDANSPEDSTTPADAQKDRALLPEDGDKDRTMLPEDADDDEDKTTTGQDESPAYDPDKPLISDPVDASRAAHAANERTLTPGLGADDRIGMIETGRKYL